MKTATTGGIVVLAGRGTGFSALNPIPSTILFYPSFSTFHNRCYYARLSRAKKRLTQSTNTQYLQRHQVVHRLHATRARSKKTLRWPTFWKTPNGLRYWIRGALQPNPIIRVRRSKWEREKTPRYRALLKKRAVCPRRCLQSHTPPSHQSTRS